MMDERVDAYLEKVDDGWKRNCLAALREVLLSCGLKEDVKWGAPVYTHHGNVAGIREFKEHVALWFFEGAMLSDPLKVLVAGSHSTQAMRQWKFRKGDAMPTDQVREYVAEAARNMENGVRTPMKGPRPLVIPDEMKALFDSEPQLRATFDGFGLGRRRELADYLAEAKRPETRQARLDRIRQLLIDKRGLNDHYR